MSQVDTVIYQIVMLSLLGLTGFVAGRSGYLSENSGTVLSRIVIRLTAPLLTLTTLANYKFTGNELMNGVRVYAFGIIFILVAYFISWFASGKLKLQETTGNIYKMQSMFGNVVFLAYPLLSALFGEQGLIYGIFFFLANDSLVWTLGIYLVNRHNTTKWKDNLKHLVNANTIAFTMGIFCVAINLQHYVDKYSSVQKVYNLLYNTFNPLGKTTIYLSMLFIGLILSEIKINSVRDLLKRYPIFILSFFRLLFVPLIALAALSFVGKLVDPLVKAIVVLQLAMPCGTIVSALAAQYESDYRFASETVFISTIFAIVTLPLMVYLLKLAGCLG